jgi:hypothetical protein
MEVPMDRRNSSLLARRNTHLAKRLVQTFSKQNFMRTARIVGATLFAITFAGVAHAQGTMDFTGAQTLMTTFNMGAAARFRRWGKPVNKMWLSPHNSPNGPWSRSQPSTDFMCCRCFYTLLDD